MPAPGDAQPLLELAAGGAGAARQAAPGATPREVFALVAKATPGYEGLDYRAIGAQGAALAPATGGAGAAEARA